MVGEDYSKIPGMGPFFSPSGDFTEVATASRYSPSPGWVGSIRSALLNRLK